MSKVKMYSSAFCPFCIRAKMLLKQKGVEHVEIISVDTDPQQKRTMIEETGRRTVPQIFIDDQHVGGFDDLAALDRQGKLDEMLSS